MSCTREYLPVLEELDVGLVKHSEMVIEKGDGIRQMNIALSLPRILPILHQLVAVAGHHGEGNAMLVVDGRIEGSVGDAGLESYHPEHSSNHCPLAPPAFNATAPI